MARTLLFGNIVRLAAYWRALGAGSTQEELSDRLRTLRRERREFLKRVGGLSVSALGLVPACGGTTKSTPEANAPEGDAGKARARVAVIGGGMAGLHCAYRLKESGVEATVYEASPRTGGRMYTDRSHFGTQVAELGGEFIDTNHTTLHSLAEALDITLDDREADLSEDTVRDVWWVNGAAVPEAMVVAQFSAVAPLIADLIDRIEEQGDDALFEQLDTTSIKDWLDEQVPTAQYPELHAILTNAYRGEYGLETDQQSSLNLLYLIGHDDPDPFRIFGASDERFHAHTGSQTFVDKLAAELDGQIRTEWRLSSASGRARGPYSLVFSTPSGEETVEEVDHVVFALPFSLLREVNLTDLELPEEKRTMIETIGYGTNAKRIGSFGARVWRSEHNSSGSVTSDLPFQQCWDTSTGQAGNQGILTNFLGGTTGASSNEQGAEEGFVSAVAEIESVFPGVTAAYQANSAVLMHWPSYAFNKGSYACYRPGQWQFWSLEGERVEKLHFCGEHTSLEFQGYMEGAAETGARAAGEILGDLDITPSAIHRALLSLREGLPERAARGTACPRARRRALLDRLNAKVLV